MLKKCLTLSKNNFLYQTVFEKITCAVAYCVGQVQRFPEPEIFGRRAFQALFPAASGRVRARSPRKRRPHGVCGIDEAPRHYYYVVAGENYSSLQCCRLIFAEFWF